MQFRKPRRVHDEQRLEVAGVAGCRANLGDVLEADLLIRDRGVRLTLNFSKEVANGAGLVNFDADRNSGDGWTDDMLQALDRSSTSRHRAAENHVI